MIAPITPERIEVVMAVQEAIGAGAIGGGVRILARNSAGTAQRKASGLGGIRSAQTGATRGIPYWDFDAAEAAYITIRGSSDDVARIANNTGMREFHVARIKEYLFNSTQRLDGGRLARLDAHPDIANAWHRLGAGNHTTKDLQLMQHELFESTFVRMFRTDVRTAHEATLRAGRPSGIE